MRLARKLDAEVASIAKEATAEGLSVPRHTRFTILGQMALLVSEAQLPLLATIDVDAQVRGEYATLQIWKRLLEKEGLEHDPLADEIWMPTETQTEVLFRGAHVEFVVATVDYVLVSKALKAPDKNKALLAEYIRRGGSDRFFSLAEKYQIDLARFI